MARNTLWTYPNFNETFKIQTDARKFQLGAVIGQKDKTINFYGRKLTDSQKRFTLIERELLSIVETIK